MRRARRLVLTVVGLLLGLMCAGLAWAQTPVERAVEMPKRLRIALVPLDDRPVCLQYPQMMAGLAHAEVVAPPIDVLGRFTTPGDTDAVARWLRAQDWRGIDALIVSLDMLAYGGLVASRVHGVNEATALARLGVLDEIHAAHPGLPIYGFSVIMRLAPTADGRNEAYRERLARWAEIAADARTGPDARELADLVAAIPAPALDDYTRARARNRAVNLAAVRRAANGVLQYLVVSQDDAKPRGVHLADRAAVTEAVRGARLADRVGIQPGADEVAMLLLARAVLVARRLSPVVRVSYSSEEARTMVAPFEDRRLHETVSFQVRAAGASEPVGAARHDLEFFVFASRHDPDLPAAFAREVAARVGQGAQAIVADVDPKGDVQGASAPFTEPLLAAGVFPKLYGYASWNTAGNTIGTALPHGLLAWAGARLATRCTSPAWTATAGAQATFMLHRLLNDYAYQGVVRPALNAELRRAGRSSLWLREHAPAVAAQLRDALEARLADYARPFGREPWTPPAPAPVDVRVRVGPPRDLQVVLPWSRTFEATITFDLPVEPVPGTAPSLPSCRPATP